MRVLILVALVGLWLAGVGGVVHAFRRRAMHLWLAPYLTTRNPLPDADSCVDVFLCIADHFEPAWGGASRARQRARVERWIDSYGDLFDRFRDSSGRPPRHTFFYPGDEYDAEWIDTIAELCRAGYGEVELQLHHDGDTERTMAEKLTAFRDRLAHDHGLLARRAATGEVAYGFVHGNWALANSRPDGRWCGVNDELRVLRETGCYADFTMPSAPSPTQSRKVNSIYYAPSGPCRPRSHDRGVAAACGRSASGQLLLVQGPLALDWRRRKLGCLPAVENGCLAPGQEPTMDRLRLWMQAGVQVRGRPNWIFVKLHTHGAQEAAMDVLLGDPMVRFHSELARRALDEPRFRYHYVTAREMYNLVKAAEAEAALPVREAVDFELIAPWGDRCCPATQSSGVRVPG